VCIGKILELDENRFAGVGRAGGGGGAGVVGGGFTTYLDTDEKTETEEEVVQGWGEVDSQRVSRRIT
jgi:hypothetical protein